MINIQFGISTIFLIGSIMINISIGQVEFYIVNTDISFLLSFADLDSLKVYFNNLKNILVIQNNNILVIYQFGHSFLLWNIIFQSFLFELFDFNFYFLTNIEL